MTAPPKHNGLTREGERLILKMQKLGILVDVAHAHINTLKDIAKMTGKPLIDSHTGLSYSSVPTGGRRRTWKEMEMVVATGGVVCTWLLAVKSKTIQRETFLEWAKEIKVMKERFGVEHIGLGTDTGGYLRGTRLIEGYKNLFDLTKLADAMLEVGLRKNDLTAFMGGNVSRVLKKCID
jgi:microsomal dipeptidase-like Zn-dependent dipeptidase